MDGHFPKGIWKVRTHVNVIQHLVHFVIAAIKTSQQNELHLVSPPNRKSNRLYTSIRNLLLRNAASQKLWYRVFAIQEPYGSIPDDHV
jgi:hypothetical protein